MIISNNEWLLEGDPSIRWQVLRDLLNEMPEVVAQERTRVASSGWGADILACQAEDGNWGKGIYSPKWTSTTYTLLLLRQLGLAPGHPQALRGCELFFFRGLASDGGINLFKNFSYSETCINGMILCLLSYFRFPDERIHSLTKFLLNVQMLDGGWNCERPKGAIHSSFHTTINALEGLAEYSQAYPQAQELIKPAIAHAHEFLWQHYLYKSHHTGQTVHLDMTRFHFPPRWHYDFLRALDYFQSIHAPRDPRMQPAIDLLLKKKSKNDRWVLNAPWPGKVFFPLEVTGAPSRWNTLRALRVLKWWNQ
ncbi:MAG: hypothetical protein WCK35_24780 [Chloroflexota bacterium]